MIVIFICYYFKYSSLDIAVSTSVSSVTRIVTQFGCLLSLREQLMLLLLSTVHSFTVLCYNYQSIVNCFPILPILGSMALMFNEIYMNIL